MKRLVYIYIYIIHTHTHTHTFAAQRLPRATRMQINGGERSLSGRPLSVANNVLIIPIVAII